MHKNYMLPTL